MLVSNITGAGRKTMITTEATLIGNVLSSGSQIVAAYGPYTLKNVSAAWTAVYRTLSGECNKIATTT